MCYSLTEADIRRHVRGIEGHTGRQSSDHRPNKANLARFTQRYIMSQRKRGGFVEAGIFR